MAWIELHDTLPDHPKTVAAAHALRIDKDALAGKLMRLWTWALRNRQSGFLSKADIGTVAEVMRWDKKPAALIRALCAAPNGYDHGFLDAVDGGYVIHDWDVYTSQFRAQDTLRKKDRERKKAAKVAPQPARKREKLSAGIPAEQTRNSSPYQYPTLREEEEEEETYALAHAGGNRRDDGESWRNDGEDRRDVSGNDRRRIHSNGRTTEDCEPSEDSDRNPNHNDRREDRAAALAGSPVDACIGTPSAPEEQPEAARPPYPQTAAHRRDTVCGSTPSVPVYPQGSAPPAPPSPAAPPAWQQVVDRHEAEIGPIGSGSYARMLQAFTAAIGTEAVCLAIEKTNLSQPKQPSVLLRRILADWQEAGVRDAASAQYHMQSRSSEQAERRHAAAHARQASHTGRRKPPPIDQLPEDYNPYYQAFVG